MGVIHHQAAPADAFAWDYATVPVQVYTGNQVSGDIERRVLVGQAEGADDFIIRYFVIPPGGNSALDQHAHQHGVVVVQGRGQVLIGEQWADISVGDAVYIAPDEIHQLRALADEPLGFICVIPTWAEQPRQP
jgi:quercetin dioxygenase-like cupin family protein